MPSRRDLAFWSLLPLYVPVVARRSRGLRRAMSNHPVDVCFYAAFMPMAWLVPRAERAQPVLPVPLGLVATVAFSSAVGLLHVALVREARHITRALLAVLLMVDLAALGVIRASVVAGVRVRVFSFARGGSLGVRLSRPRPQSAARERVHPTKPIRRFEDGVRSAVCAKR